MAQVYNADTYSGDHVASTDLQNIENNFAALKSFFSGVSAPGDAVAFMPWGDTTQKVLKYRDSANSAWLGLMFGDVSQKIPVYRDAAMDGWAIDSSVTDRVVALKGGTTYTTGGAVAGSWTISGLTHAHTIAHTHTGPSHNHSVPRDGWGTESVAATGRIRTGFGNTEQFAWGNNTSGSAGTGATGAPSNNATGVDGGSDGAWRPSALVCTLQYLDL